MLINEKMLKRFIETQASCSLLLGTSTIGYSYRKGFTTPANPTDLRTVLIRPLTDKACFIQMHVTTVTTAGICAMVAGSTV